jgi:hypothetical protein
MDAVAEFIDHVEPSVVGGYTDPVDPTRICESGHAVDDLYEPLDGTPDSFTAVPAGTLVCFDIHVKQNWTVPSLEDPQTFEAEVDIIADGVTVVDTRTIYFLVPPYFWSP